MLKYGKYYIMNKKGMLEQLYHQYKNLMFRIAFSILNDSSLAEDAIHAAFMKLLNNSFAIDDINSKETKAFMILVVRNAAIDIYNKVNKQNNKYLDIDTINIADSSPTPIEFIINQESLDKIKNKLREIDSKYADVIVLKYFYDYSYAEISSLLSISEQTVRVRMHRAKKILASQLNDGGCIL